MLLIVICLVLFGLYVIYDYYYPRLEAFEGTLGSYIKGRPQVSMEEAPFAYYTFAKALKSNKFEGLDDEDGNNELVEYIHEQNGLNESSDQEVKDEVVFNITRRLNNKANEKFYTLESIQKDIKYFNSSSNLEHFMWMNNHSSMEED